MTVSMKYDLAWWSGMDLALAGWGVQILMNSNWTFFLVIFGFGMKVKG